MMRNKISQVLAIAAAILLTQTAMAQSRMDKLMTSTTPEERAELQTQNMKESLSLSEEQYQRVHELNLKYARRMQSIYQTDGGKLQRLKSMKATSEEKDRELKRILDSRQYKLYKDQKEEMKENARKQRR